MNDLTGIDQRLKAVMSRLFDVKPEQLDETTKRGGLERWDSLGHLELMEALGREFAVTIPPEQALDMETVADIKRIVGALARGHG